jgi:hypothetical protein
MKNQESALDQLTKLQLPERSYMIMGSGILEALNIRMAEDIDMVVNQEAYTYFLDAGWTERIASNGAKGLERGIFQAYDRWSDEGVVKTLDELLINAEWVNGIPFNSLARLSLYKKRRGREKDIADLELIERFMSSQQ